MNCCVFSGPFESLHVLKAKIVYLNTGFVRLVTGMLGVVEKDNAQEEYSKFLLNPKSSFDNQVPKLEVPTWITPEFMTEIMSKFREDQLKEKTMHVHDAKVRKQIFAAIDTDSAYKILSKEQLRMNSMLVSIASHRIRLLEN